MLAYTLIAYFLKGKYISFFLSLSLSVFKDAWYLVKRLRMALVFFQEAGISSSCKRAAFCFCEITVRTSCAIDNLTMHLDFGELVRSTTSDLCDTKKTKLCLQLSQ
ncbi:hypothetical protein AABB24_032711 [Solanum stoloniferum]|uniref:Secreted protein n=1 Tax=Solanum stoloniferum TaxID=62892 RepID=A0ABD2RK67_9SOLN